MRLALSPHRGTNSTEDTLGEFIFFCKRWSQHSCPLGLYSLLQNQGAMGIGGFFFLNNGGLVAEGFLPEGKLVNSL